jgi:hypothetical protein
VDTLVTVQFAFRNGYNPQRSISSPPIEAPARRRGTFGRVGMVPRAGTQDAQKFLRRFHHFSECPKIQRRERVRAGLRGFMAL